MDALGLIALSGGGSSGGSGESGSKFEVIYEQDGFGHDTYSFNCEGYDAVIICVNESVSSPIGTYTCHLYVKSSVQQELRVSTMNNDYYKYRIGSYKTNGSITLGNGKYRALNNWSQEVTDKRAVNVVCVIGIKF